MNNKLSWFGIDFGTTNSAAFSFTGIDMNSINPINYGDDEGRPFPSVVAINKTTGEVITGRDAKSRRNELIGDYEYFSSIKSVIDSNNTWNIAGKMWTPEDIAAEIFLALKRRVEQGTSCTLDEAVVAVPNGFTADKKTHLRNAALKAGIKIKMFVAEPTAAFCSNYTSLKSCNNVAVFDWGGGTLDVTVLKVENGKIMEIASSGMQFAGDDIDRKFAQKMHARFMRNKTPSISFDELDPVTKDQLLSRCEQAKCDFEDEDIVSLTMVKYGNYGPVRDSIDYDYFSLLLEDDINNAISCLEEAISKAGLNRASLDCILCVGGSSKLRPLKERLISEYGESMVYYPERVMWDIAKGAAITATKESGYRLSKSIGILLSDDTYLPLLKEGQRIPCEELKITLGTVADSEECSTEARFVFTDSENKDKRSFVETMILPLRGFADEYINLRCYVDPDNIFKLKVGSNRMVEDVFRVWSYDKLKVSFFIEGE